MRSLIILAFLLATACGAPASPEPATPADESPTEPTPPADESSTEPAPDAPDESSSPSDPPEADLDSTANPDNANPPPVLQPDPDPQLVELELSMDRHVGTGYGCGGMCASNTSGSSSVVLLCMKDETAMMMDAGEETHTMNYPDGSSSETTAWSYAWKGTCLREGPALVFEMERTTSICNKSAVTNNQKSTSPCVNSTKKVLIGCKLGDVTVVDEIGVGGKTKGKKKEQAWTCKPDGKNVNLGGTPTPWVFGDASCIDTWYVGEPKADTHLKPCEP